MEPDPLALAQLPNSKHIQERLKIITRSAIELAVGLLAL